MPKLFTKPFLSKISEVVYSSVFVSVLLRLFVFCKVFLPLEVICKLPFSFENKDVEKS